MPAPRHSPDPDTSLVVGLRAGDVQAFETLFRAEHPGLCAFVTRYVGDAGRAEEIVQDVLYDLWMRRATLDLQGSIRGLLYTAARNRALNLRRRDATEQAWMDDEAHDDVRLLHQRPPVPDALVERDAQLARLQAAFAGLPERCRAAMELRWTHELSYSEVASALGIGIKAVEKQLARGLRLLRNALQDS